MTDITELAQSLKAAAEKATQGNWRAFQYHDGRCGIGGGHNDEIMVCEHISKERPHDAMFIALANPANILALVEALENANRYIERLREWNAGLAQESCERQQLISELEPIRAAAEKLVRCKGRYHSEQNYRALAALFGVKTPDLPPLEHENVHYADAAEMEIEALRQRIAELEESNAQVIQSRDHYKRMTEEGLKQLAEARTVKLPDLRQIVSGDRYVWSDGVYNYSQDVKVALAAAGIKVEAE
ncbi:ead/Ea22-like family protein [Klebsiella pneumoniae]|nr:ead/Ea22-like family protein [Klebsiella pneumoniae]